jgi:hypothetical protein
MPRENPGTHPLPLKEKKAETPTYDAIRLGAMLPELSRLIVSFLDNPVFHMTSVNDSELRSTAGRDLVGIIRLSETINKIAKRLAKTSTQRPLGILGTGAEWLVGRLSVAGWGDCRGFGSSGIEKPPKMLRGLKL